ncbi:DUF1501 domain-containing protein [Algisphaera agarilytica]|uniref:Uncharacterized protein (DUF1501 family) n=1 Tax=Algisphaera agarilytica TaxID=1385975 RepID=A0A7X0H815_9BACT|nr:DUF1501 domain-containing protein [Algisphaera agarilytica]MBB6429519.1 uncharacterized protein (DUF1501 family) [Algisphaera agarilytica]
MDDNLDNLISRRSLLRRGSCAALGIGGLMSQLFNLRMTSAALAQSGGGFSDYKALVCVFLFGGNDAGNTIIPISGGNQNYSDYAAGRTGLAIPLNSLNATTFTPAGSTRQFAFHPQLTDVHNLFNQGNMAVVANAGSLVEPTTLTQYQNRSVALPPQLFAHNTQQELWQISTADAIGRIGWGGRIADSLQALGAQNDSGVSMNISIAGSNYFLTGNQVTPYAVSPNGAIGLDTTALGSTSDREIIANAYADLIALQGNPNYSARNELSKAYADVAGRALRNEDIISSIDARQDPNTGDSVLRNLAVPDGNSLAAQLGAVARLIESGPSILGQNRQVFFVSLGGFDNHNGLIGPHDDNLARVNDALKYFWDALGLLNRRDDVTTFTASDFGRTYRSNGNGSDHGWGGHHFVMGGTQVDGGKMYGDYGNIAIGGPEDTGNGRFIPTTSVDEYAFEFARWIGVPTSEMGTMFPNLGRFLDVNNPSTHLGFMNI